MLRRLGKTNLFVNEIGFGGIPIQRVTEKEAINIIESLQSNNINFIDTARGYTNSEELIGLSLGNNRKNFIIATKSMSRTYSAMKKDIETSLKNLRTDYIDLYQFHNLKSKADYDIVMGEDGAYKALKEAKDKGLIKHIGLTSHSVDFVLSIIDDFLFETIQIPYNVVETQAEELFRKAKEKNIGIIVMKPLAGGAFKDTALPLKFILNNDNISVLIVGMDSVEQVENNSKAVKEEFTEKDKQEIIDIRVKLGNDFCRRCGYCLPCSVGIDIPSCFTFLNYLERYDLESWARSRYATMENKASKCIKCGKCEASCPYSLPIIKKLEHVKDMFE